MSSIYYIYMKIIKPYVTIDILSSSICKKSILYKEKIFLQLFGDSILYNIEKNKQSNYLQENVVNDNAIGAKQYSKFDIYCKYYKNLFITESQKDELNESFFLSQKCYRALCKLAYLYKLKKSKKYEFDTDLCFTSLDNLSEKCKIKLYDSHSNSIYIFRISDLIKIINDALSYSPDFFTSPLYIKNPFTNIKFTKSQLYYIYFTIKKSDYIMPTLFHLYFLDNFNLYLFSINNESIIRDSYIENYSRTFSDDVKLELIEQMFSFFFQITFTLDDTYLSILNQPSDILLNLFDKVIPDYLYATYSLNPDVRNYKSKKITKYIRHVKNIMDSNEFFSIDRASPNINLVNSNQSGFTFVYNV